MRHTFFNSCTLTRASSITFWIARGSVTLANKNCLWRARTFSDVAIDMVTELLMIGLRRNGCILRKELLPLLLRMRSSDDALLSDLFRMRGRGQLLVFRSCQICHSVTSFIAHAQSWEIFSVARLQYSPHFCQIYCTVVNSITHAQ